MYGVDSEDAEAGAVAVNTTLVFIPPSLAGFESAAAAMKWVTETGTYLCVYVCVCVYIYNV